VIAMSLNAIEIATLSPAALAALRQRVQRAKSFSGDIYPEDAIPASLDYLKPGQIFGRFREPITRREVRRDGIPAWFDPEHTPGQMGIIDADGLRCYIELQRDEEARNAPSTFEAGLLALAEDEPEQTSLLF
jgi:hypothetical protein